MEGMMSEGDAEKAARAFWERAHAGEECLTNHDTGCECDVAALVSLLHKREAAAWKAGTEAMREKAAVYLDGVAKTWHDDAQPDRADDADNYAHAVRALPIPEPGRCGCNGDYPCDGAHRR
jgi:hypothetical protein